MHFQAKHADFAAKWLFFLTLAGLVYVAYLAGGVDFRSYYGAATVVTQGGNPYNYSELAPVLEDITGYAGNSPYFYPPWFSLLIIPFTLLSFQDARLLWLIVNGILFYAALPFLQEALKYKLEGWKRYVLYLLVTLNFAAYCLRSEQVGIILLFMLGVTLVSTMKRRHSLAGIGLVLLLTKPQITLPIAILLGIWMLVNRRLSLVWGTAWTVVLLIGSSIAVPGWWHIDRDSFGMGLLYELDGPESIAAERVVSTLYDFSEFVLHLNSPRQYFLWGIFAILGALLLVATWKRTSDVTARISAVLLVTFLLTPYALQYDYVLLVLPFFWVFMHLPDQELKYQIGTVGLLAFNFSVLLWQEWSYQGYLQLLAIAGAFALTLYSTQRQTKVVAETSGNPTLET